MSYRTGSGAVIKFLRGDQLLRQPAFHYYSLYGTKGCLETSRPPEPLRTNASLEQIPHLHGMIQMPLTCDVPDSPAAAAAGGHGTAEYYMVQDFLESVRRDTAPPIDIYRALDMSLPGLCAQESSLDNGRPVEVPDWR